MALYFWWCFCGCGHLATHFFHRDGIDYPACDECDIAEMLK